MPNRKRKRPRRPSNRAPGFLRSLAEKVGRSESHVSRVVSGDRASVALTEELEAAAGMTLGEIREKLAAERIARVTKMLATPVPDGSSVK